MSDFISECCDTVVNDLRVYFKEKSYTQHEMIATLTAICAGALIYSFLKYGNCSTDPFELVKTKFLEELGKHLDRWAGSFLHENPYEKDKGDGSQS